MDRVNNALSDTEPSSVQASICNTFNQLHHDGPVEIALRVCRPGIVIRPPQAFQDNVRIPMTHPARQFALAFLSELVRKFLCGYRSVQSEIFNAFPKSNLSETNAQGVNVVPAKEHGSSALNIGHA